MDAVEESNHRCDGPHLQFMTHLQHVLIESEATPMRLMPCVPPTQTGLPLPSTRLQVFSAHGNAVAAAAATEANLCSTPSSSDGVERIFAFPEGRAPSGASVHRFDAAVVSTVAPPAASQHSQRRRRRRRRGGGGDQGGRGDEGSGPGDHFDDPIFEKGNRRTTTARSGSATDALLWVSPMIGLSV